MQRFKDGAIYDNVPKEAGGQTLPEGVTYKEYDIQQNYKLNNNERIVIGDDGSVWYTKDYYYTFKELGIKSYAKPNAVVDYLNGRLELIGSTREKLLSVVQDYELNKIVDQLYRPGATRSTNKRFRVCNWFI